jgi:hypothetical protein
MPLSVSDTASVRFFASLFSPIITCDANYCLVQRILPIQGTRGEKKKATLDFRGLVLNANQRKAEVQEPILEAI